MFTDSSARIKIFIFIFKEFGFCRFCIENMIYDNNGNSGIWKEKGIS
jgi:hypothetical protein